MIEIQTVKKLLVDHLSPPPSVWSYASHGAQCGVTTCHTTCGYCVRDYHISFRLFALSNPSMTSTGPHLVPFKPGSNLSKTPQPNHITHRTRTRQIPNNTATPHPGPDREKSPLRSHTQKNLVNQRKSIDSE